MDNEEIIEDPTVNGLLLEMKKSRNELYTHLDEIVKQQELVANLFPDKLDARNKHVIDDKLKIYNEFNGNRIRIRQEIHKTIKDEIIVRRDISKNNKIKNEIDIRDIANQIEEYENSNNK